MAILYDWPGRAEEAARVVRRGQQARRDEKRAQKDLDRDIEESKGAYRPVARELCVERSRIFAIDDGFEFRVELRYWRLEGKTTEFVYLFQRRVWEDWENVARIDCSNHGSCHVHDPYEKSPTEHLMRLDSIEDVPKAMRLAQERASMMFKEMTGGEAT